MLISLLIAILLLAVVSLFSERLPKAFHHYLLWAIVLFFTVVCIVRPTSYDSDFRIYEKYFFGFDDTKYQLIVEPVFLWICKTVYYAGGTIHTVIIIFAVLSVPLKLYSIHKMTEETVFILAVIIYASNYFMLHDCEQIRLAVGMAFCMYALLMKMNGHYVWMVSLWLIAISFHHTTAAYAIPFLAPKDMGRYWKIAIGGLVPIAILLWLLHINPITVLPIPYIEPKMKLYEMAISQGQHPDVRTINLMVLVRIALFYYIFYFYETIKEHLPSLPLLMLCNALSLSAWFALTDMSVIAVRISQLFGFVEVILFASIYYTIKPAWMGKSVVFLIALYFYFQNYIYNQFGFR